jgi:hypothetical protein
MFSSAARRLCRAIAVGTITAATGLALLATPASADPPAHSNAGGNAAEHSNSSGHAGSTEPSSSPTATNPSNERFECGESHHSNTGHGANNDGGYQSTCDPADFGGNGQEFGPGNHTGQPCAGCVGNADDKNPPGQYPDGSDHNSGYECDGRDRPANGQQGNGNHGIGDENPAHTGCQSAPAPYATPPVFACPSGMAGTDSNANGTVEPGECNPPQQGRPTFTCPTGMTGTDTNGNGTVQPGECNPPPQGLTFTCPTGMTGNDTNGNGTVDPGECAAPASGRVAAASAGPAAVAGISAVRAVPSAAPAGNGSPNALARTGFDLAPIVAGAVMLVLAGTIVRRRHQH